MTIRLTDEQLENLIECYENGYGDIEKFRVIEELLELRKVSERMAAQLAGLVAGTQHWNEAVEKIIGRIPQTGIGDGAISALTAYEQFKKGQEQ